MEETTQETLPIVLTVTLWAGGASCFAAEAVESEAVAESRKASNVIDTCLWVTKRSSFKFEICTLIKFATTHHIPFLLMKEVKEFEKNVRKI
jgi:hypothetical protein